MRTYILFPILCVFALACKKTSSGSNAGNPPGNGGSTITIASVSPQQFYVDDQITITGTGFNPDKTKDTVDFGAVDSSTSAMTFYPIPFNSNKDYTIVSASSTEIIIKAVKPDSLYQRIYPSPINNLGVPSGEFRVRSGGASASSSYVGFKRFPSISGNVNFTYAYTPGDSVEVLISGVLTNSDCAVNLYISGSKSSGCNWAEQYFNTNLYFVSTPCPCTDYATLLYGCGGNGSAFKGRLLSYDADNLTSDVIIYIPKDFFGTVHGQGFGPVVDVYAKVVNSDGRSSDPVLWALATFPDH
jgi:hypothetical protein